jgi:hypothetical protein
MRPLKQVVMVPGQVGVVETTSTTMSHTRNHICCLLPRSLQRCSLHSFSEVSAIPSNLRKNMEDFLHTIANNVQHGNNQGGGNGVNQYSSFKDFMDTRPPIFKEATEPLDAEEWINTMEDKFRVLRLTEVLKTEYATHQLQRTSRNVVEASSHHLPSKCSDFVDRVH